MNVTSYRVTSQIGLFVEELLIDNFAGGGGASTGIEMALGRPVDIAVNHDTDAIDMHTLNHPHTRHYCESVWEVDPREITQGLPVGLAWFSPDCKHFSKAKGSVPVNKEIRGLAWVAVRWAATVRPRIIMLENVEEFMTWGPIVDGRPCPKRKGKTFESFKRALERHGYEVQFNTLVASDFGAPTSRKRFFMIARCDGEPIVWPTPTHGNPALPGFKKSKLKPWRTAADIIDWSIPCPSIFERKKPLAENTMRRIARGIERFVLNDPEPFILRIGQTGFGGDRLSYPVEKPLTTVTTKAEHCLVAPYIQPYYGDKAPIARGRKLSEPIATQTTENRFSLVAAFLAKHYGGNYTGPGSDIQQPVPTITTVDHNALVTAHIQRDFGQSIGSAANDPLKTITAGGGGHNALVTSNLIKLRGTSNAAPVTSPVPTITAGGLHIGEVRAFLLKYYGTNIGHSLNEPVQTVTTKHRFGLVTVRGEQYQIVDIGMRMLEPHELYAAQGFPSDYIVDTRLDGTSRPKYQQVARCGNSVCPDVAAALVSHNYQPMHATNRKAVNDAV